MKKLIERFVRDECVNYDTYYKTCLDDKPCKVLAGERCGYFERCVLGPVDYKYRLPDYDYAKLFGEYAELTGGETKAVRVRRCSCGAVLRIRQRFCADCSKKRAKTANRQRQQKYRFSKCINVTV